MLLAPLLLLAAVATATASPTAAPDAWLDRPAEEVFVPKCDMLVFLPELLVQLDIPAAGIDLGRINSRLVLRKELSPAGTNTEIVDDRPERLVGPLEMKKGTVRQVLDELVRQRPELSWRNENGVLLISSSATKGSVVQPVLDCRLPEFKVDKKPLDWAAAEMEEPIRVLQPAEKKTINWIMTMWRMHPVLEPRQTLDVPVTLDNSNTPVRQLLTDMVRQVPGAFWIAYDEVNDPVGATERFGVITISRIGSDRRKLDLQTLIRCLDETYTPLHGCQRVVDRVNEAERELRRRQHFQADEVREALLKPEGLPRIVAAAKPGYMVGELMQWAWLLHDQQLTVALLELIPTIKNADRRRECLMGLWGTVIYEPELRKVYFPLWKRLAEDENLRVRQEAQKAVDYMQKNLTQNPERP
jgi:hypothetical protein